MNVLLLILGAAVLFPLAFRIYSRILARNFGEDPQRTLPAVFMTVTTLAEDVILFAFAIGLVVISFRVGSGLGGEAAGRWSLRLRPLNKR